MKISDKALKDFWKEKMTGWFVEEENVILRRYHNWLNENRCQNNSKHQWKDKGDGEGVCLTCGQIQITPLPRYKTYEERE